MWVANEGGISSCSHLRGTKWWTRNAKPLPHPLLCAARFFTERPRSCLFSRWQVYKLRNEEELYETEYPDRMQLLHTLGFQWDHSASTDEWDLIIMGRRFFAHRINVSASCYCWVEHDILAQEFMARLRTSSALLRSLIVDSAIVATSKVICFAPRPLLRDSLPFGVPFLPPILTRSSRRPFLGRLMPLQQNLVCARMW